MTHIQKKIFYDFLKVAAQCYTGYTPKVFEGEPQFFDDKVVEVAPQTSPKSSSLTKKDSPFALITKETLGACETTQDVYALSKNCYMCALFKNRTEYLAADPKRLIEVHPVDVAVITDTPLVAGGAEEALLEKMLEAIGLSLKANATTLSAVLCPSNLGKVARAEEVKACKTLVKRLIELQNPKQILCLGEVALMHFAGIYSGEGIAKLRHRSYLYNMRQNVYVTYSLDALFRNESLKTETWKDLKALRKRLDKEG